MGPEIAPPQPSSPPPYRAGPPHRRLVRSSRERMWAGVCGGIAEYFEIDPSLIRLLWVAATVVSGGLAVPVYILAWIILPRDDRPPVSGNYQWRDWSQEFHAETQRLAEEARRVAGEVHHTQPDAPSSPPPPPSSAQPTPPVDAQEEWWRTPETAVEPRRHHLNHHPRSAGVILVGLGVLLLAANAGIFSWIEWRTMWPLIFIGLGLILLAKQTDWGR